MTRVVGAQELGKRVAREAARTGVAPDRLRKWIASAALLELFNVAFAEGRISDYCIKGGFAVELRNPSLARASQDIDVVVTGDVSDRAMLETVIAQAWTLFTFTIKSEERRDHATRLLLQAVYNNVPWTTIKLDIVREPVEAIEAVDAH
ncbi:MAG: nucleotidyl transferase AbiEii/AbiGii toxin family protein, partial [Candidatus Binataceae bacterium]